MTGAKITPGEYREAVRRAHAECGQEITAATAEYKDANRPIAARRKQRSRAARTKRDTRLAELRAQAGIGARGTVGQP